MKEGKEKNEKTRVRFFKRKGISDRNVLVKIQVNMFMGSTISNPYHSYSQFLSATLSVVYPVFGT